MERLPNIHPGEILLKDFLEPMGITAYRLAKEIGVQQSRISQILRGERAVTPDTAKRFAIYFNTTPRLWLNLQLAYEVEELDSMPSDAYDHIKPVNARAA